MYVYVYIYVCKKENQVMHQIGIIHAHRATCGHSIINRLSEDLFVCACVCTGRWEWRIREPPARSQKSEFGLNLRKIRARKLQ